MSKMTSQFFRLINDDIATNCFKTIADFVATGKTTTVTVDFEDDSDRARTLAQNRIYWLWVQVIADKEGNDKDTQHAMLKRNFLAKILCRSNAELVPVFESVKNCEQYMGVTEYDNFAIFLSRLCGGELLGNWKRPDGSFLSRLCGGELHKQSPI